MRVPSAFFGLVAGVLLLPGPLPAQQPAVTNAASATMPAGSTNAAGTAPALTDVKKLMVDALHRFQTNDNAGALNDTAQVIKIDPKNIDAYLLRGSVYYRQKLWAQATDEFKMAQQISPASIVVKYNLAEVQFAQKQYELARPGFVAIEGDPGLGDLATYKVFLCDLFGGHEDVASKELDVLNQKAEDPSYFFCNAAWSLYHKNIEDARGWLASAVHIYPVRKNEFYASTLKDLGYLPLPPPSAK